MPRIFEKTSTIPSNATHFFACYYNDTVMPPKHAGELVTSTWHVGLSSAQTEVNAAMYRKDLGRITMGEYYPGKFSVTYERDEKTGEWVDTRELLL